MIGTTKRIPLLIALIMSCSASVYGKGFYCPNSQKMTCLDYGEKVVGGNAICFDRFECSQEGFVCKSQLDGLVFEHENLVEKHNELSSRYNELVGVYESTVTEYRAFKRCVETASTLADVQGCGPES